MAKMLRSPSLWLGLLISVLCLFYIVQGLGADEWADLEGRLYGGTYLWLVPAALMQVLSVVARSYRWQALLDQRDQLWSALWAQGIGFLFTNTLPLRLGEPARVLIMAERTKLSIMQVAVTAVIERGLDVATTVLLLVLVLPFIDVPTQIVQAGFTLGAVVLLGFALLPLLVRYEERIARWLDRLSHRVTWLPTESILKRWTEIVRGMRPFTHFRSLMIILGWSLMTWVVAIAMYVFGIRVFQPAGSPVEASFVVVTLAFAATIPSSPGFLGVYQAAGQFALATAFPDKYDPALALACTMSCWAVYFFTTNLLGLAGMSRVGASFKELARRVIPR